MNKILARKVYIVQRSVELLGYNSSALKESEHEMTIVILGYQGNLSICISDDVPEEELKKDIQKILEDFMKAEQDLSERDTENLTQRVVH